jgi:hypothetical protein
MALLSWIVFTVAIGFIKPPPHSCWREMNSTHQSIERVGYTTSSIKPNIRTPTKRQIVIFPTVSLKNLTKTKEIINQGKTLVLNKTNPLLKNVVNSTINRIMNTTLTTSRRRKLITTTTTPRSKINYDDYEDDDVDIGEEDDSINENRQTTKSKSSKQQSGSDNYLSINKAQQAMGNPISITVTNVSLVRPLASPILYEKKDVRNVFMVFLLLIIIGEFFSAPAITLAVRFFFKLLNAH